MNIRYVYIFIFNELMMMHFFIQTYHVAVDKSKEMDFHEYHLEEIRKAAGQCHKMFHVIKLVAGERMSFFY